jgi:hypothetical protein
MKLTACSIQSRVKISELLLKMHADQKYCREAGLRDESELNDVSDQKEGMEYAGSVSTYLTDGSFL